jgi:putative addiction module component (TIGR02574 family)
MEQLSISSELKKFSTAEKILIVEELRDSIADDQEKFELTGEERNEPDRRVSDYFLSPDAGYSWEEVKNRLLRPTAPTEKCKLLLCPSEGCQKGEHKVCVAPTKSRLIVKRNALTGRRVKAQQT